MGKVVGNPGQVEVAVADGAEEEAQAGGVVIFSGFVHKVG